MAKLLTTPLSSVRQFILASLSISALLYLLNLNYNSLGAVGFACFIILLFGLPHGAFDLVILRQSLSTKQMIKALCLYMLIGSAYVGLWLVFPSMFLVTFLILSMIHFGQSDWPKESFVVQLGWGMAILGVASATHLHQVSYFLESIAPQPYAFYCSVGLSVSVLIGLIIILSFSKHRFILASLVGCTALVYSISNPLIGFATYFCLFHSIRHLEHCRDDIGYHKNTIIHWMTGVVIIGCLALLFVFDTDLSHSDLDYLKITFIALAALTLPHSFVPVMTQKRS